MKRKKSPPSPIIVQRVKDAQSVVELTGVLNEVRYAGDLKQIAESYGLHYLKSKRMRTRELMKWIVDNHPVSRTSEHVMGVDWGVGFSVGLISEIEVMPDGSIKVLKTETVDG